MSKRWTEAQSEAIFTQKCNLLVAAGAGTGKTAVLVERIIQKITDDSEDVDIDKLLVVTFTNAAASEMKERIGEALSNLLEVNYNSKNIQKQLALLNQSNIMTIHSFCLKVIKSNFHLIDLDPNFRVCDNTESMLLKQDALEEVLEEKYQEEEGEFLRLVDSFGNKNDIKLQNMVMSLYEFSKSNPWPKRWLQEAVENFNVEEDFNFEDTIWAKTLTHSLDMEINGYKDKMENAVKMIKDTKGLEHYLSPFENDIETIYRMLGADSWHKMKREFIKLEFDKLPVKKVEDDIKNIKEKVKNIRDEVKKKLNDIRESIFLSSVNVGKDMKEVYPRIKCLVSLVIDFSDKYYDKKRARGILDFSDIEHFCLEILTDVDDMGNKIPSQIALEYRRYFEEIFIDEYQDSNEVQEVIMNMISRKAQDANLFMVGDVKQSIYRFRQSKPELFLQKYAAYSEKKGSRNRKIKLSENFRSRKEIIDAVNYLFKQIMCREIGELDYDDDECLISSAKYGVCQGRCGGDIEIYIADKKETGEGLELDNQELLDNIQVEARIVAERINELINPKSNGECFKIYDKVIDSYRAVMYKDIVILMRATQNWAPTFVEQLNDLGIPVFADTSVGYFEAIEIKTVISLLEIIDNPIQDIPLIAVLRSPIEVFSPEELMDLRIVNREVPFYEILKAVAEEKAESKYSLDHIGDELKYKVKAFLKKLNSWRKRVIYMPIDEFIWHLYTETGYYGFVGAMPGGIQRQANLRMLFERAKQYEKSSYKGLFNFINFMNKIKNSSGDLGSAKVLGENENVVRIMSIHKSKGLEFPVVILAGAGKNFNLTDVNKSVLFHNKLGFGPDCVNVERHISYPTVMKQVLKRKLKVETLSEEMRILYVAFTRAKEKLIITGMINDVEKTAKNWCEYASYSGVKLPEYSLINAKNFLDWIGPAVARHPCGKSIRDISKAYGNLNWIIEGDNSKWKVCIKSKDSFIKGISKEKTCEDIMEWIKNLDLNCSERRYENEVHKRLGWKYKYGEASKIPAKFSVSELKRRFKLIDRENSVEFIEPVYLKKPLFLKEKKGFTAAERGTIMHLVMQHIDIKKVNSYSEIEEQIYKLVLREFITGEEAKSVSIQKILKFFNSPLGAGMKVAKNLYREVPFYMEIDSSEIYKELPQEIYGSEKVLVQGIIDCYFQEKNELVLVDYKTDYVESVEKIKEKYRIQIYYYARALEKLTGKRVKNKYLYLFYSDNTLEV
ncbi:helicase-exonuclease AddAB subunit AddA [Clostridium sp. Mt-5]|uniref:ATP-dependent helicase/nuclease subunit A n=1 Tax=Clostridium moutaii TaxID=3240932 RepID=A0ABV4BRY1_9CLOT